MKQSTSFLELCKNLNVDPDGIPEVTSYEHACEIVQPDPEILKALEALPPCDNKKRLIADHKLTVIAAALRNGKQVNYTNSSEKYFPYFIVRANKDNPSGVGLSFTDVDNWRTTSHVGVRLCFSKYNVAEYFGKQFMDLHTDHHLFT